MSQASGRLGGDMLIHFEPRLKPLPPAQHAVVRAELAATADKER